MSSKEFEYMDLIDHAELRDQVRAARVGNLCPIAVIARCWSGKAKVVRGSASSSTYQNTRTRSRSMSMRRTVRCIVSPGVRGGSLVPL
jgi:hypothetical protein